MLYHSYGLTQPHKQRAETGSSEVKSAFVSVAYGQTPRLCAVLRVIVSTMFTDRTHSGHDDELLQKALPIS